MGVYLMGMILIINIHDVICLYRYFFIQDPHKQTIFDLYVKLVILLTRYNAVTGRPILEQ